MSAIINGSSPSVTFSDGTTQATSAIVSGYVPYANLPAGSVLQVVQGTIAGLQSTSSTSFTTAGLNASITPKFATSKILVMVDLCQLFSTVANTEALATVYRGATNIAPSGSGTYQCFAGQYQSSGQAYSNVSFSYLDSPTTTSSTTYTIYYASKTGNAIQINPNGQTSVITLMEIAA